MTSGCRSQSQQTRPNTLVKGDLLYRALYIRREYELVSSVAARGCGEEGLRDVLLLPPACFTESTLASGSVGFAGSDQHRKVEAGETKCSEADPMLEKEKGWPGLVFVRHSPSPWYQACFPFTIYFPSRYPFECPIVEFAAPLKSHPLLQPSQGGKRVEATTSAGAMVGCDAGAGASSSHPFTTGASAVNLSTSGRSTDSTHRYCTAFPFEDEYVLLDPMRVSVMARALQCVRTLFYPSQWPASWQRRLQLPLPQLQLQSHDEPREEEEASQYSGDNSGMARVDRVLARRDVERCSVSQEIILGKPYADYIESDVLAHFLEMWQRHGLRGERAPPAADMAHDVLEDAEDDRRTAEWSEWFTRTVLPHILSLP